MKLKKGVAVQGLSNEILLAIMIANTVYESFGHALVITSLLDGRHSATSLHYSGNAVDLRISYLPKGAAEGITEKIKEYLGVDYDVILESDHLHIEHQPRRKDA